MKIDCSNQKVATIEAKWRYWKIHWSSPKRTNSDDNVLNDVMFGVLSGLLKAKEHMRIESSEVATVELKPYESETETCVITLNKRASRIEVTRF